ncbi:hypothetical protein COO59_05755 [Mixta theicola]|uniref:Uncharacterized protein n=1 Tax=Mixta theicola TaxID=1458355 RepID=A0A2K1QC58_9GAMM|nr:hypothetical protein [Mixta theicola]PNS12624.1 hypothetical protein COO59_05755 [Mixta theicola]GLR10191.1 hypothetical protein GCM10007905_29110 [Mixta theicola]
MKKMLRVLSCVIILFSSALFIAWPYIKMMFAGSAYYTQQDKREYEFYTPALLKNMPRISKNYRFEFGNITGPEAHVFTVRFDGTTETTRIRNYLISVGYEPQAECDVKAECWLSPRTKDIVTLIKYTDTDSVAVQIYRMPEPITAKF